MSHLLTKKKIRYTQVIVPEGRMTIFADPVKIPEEKGAWMQTVLEK